MWLIWGSVDVSSSAELTITPCKGWRKWRCWMLWIHLCFFMDTQGSIEKQSQCNLCHVEFTILYIWNIKQASNQVTRKKKDYSNAFISRDASLYTQYYSSYVFLCNLQTTYGAMKCHFVYYLRQGGFALTCVCSFSSYWAATGLI